MSYYPSSSKNSLISKTTEAKHGIRRLNIGGAKMFSDALRGIVISRNDESSRNSSGTNDCGFDEDLEDIAAFDRSDNLAITVQVAFDPSDTQKAPSRKITLSVPSESRPHSPNPVIEKSICVTSEHSISSNPSSKFPVNSSDSLQTLNSQYHFSNEEVDSQASRLSDLSLFYDEYSDRSENNINNANEVPFNPKVASKLKTQNLKLSQSNHSFQNSNDRCNSVFNENEKAKLKINSDVSFRNPFASKKTSDTLSCSSSQRYSVNDYTCDESFKENKIISSSLNEQHTQKSLLAKHKSVVRSSSVNKSEYFTPKSFLGKMYDFPVNYNYISSSSSTQSIPEIGNKGNSSQCKIYPEQLSKNYVSYSNPDLLNNNVFSSNKIPKAKTGYNYQTRIESEKACAKGLNKNTLLNDADSQEFANLDTIKNSNIYEKSSIEASKRHHMPLSEIFGPAERLDNTFLEKSTNGLCDILKCKQNLIRKEITTVKNEYSNTVSVESHFNNCENEKLLKNEMSVEYEKATLPKKEDLCSSYFVPISLEDKNKTDEPVESQSKNFGNELSKNEMPVKYENGTLPKKKGLCSSYSVPLHLENQNKSEKYIIPAKRVKQFKNDSAINKVSPKVLYEAVYVESKGSENAMANPINSLLPPNNFTIKGIEKPIDTNLFAYSNILQKAQPISQNVVGMLPQYSKIDRGKDLLEKQALPLNNSHTSYLSAAEYTTSFNKNSVDAKQITAPVKENSCSPSSDESASDSAIIKKKTVRTKRMIMPVKKHSTHSLLTKGSEESQDSSDSVSNASSNEQPSCCYGHLPTKTISNKEYFEQQGLVLNCYTDFVVSPKFSCESNGNVPLSSSVLEVVPDLLLGTCLVDSSD